MNLELTTRKPYLPKLYYNPTKTCQGTPRPEKSTYTTKLYHNPTTTNQGICRPKQKHTLLGFIAIVPKLVKDSLGPKQASMPTHFFTNTMRNFLVSTLRLYHNLAITSQGVPRPLGMYLRPPHLVPKPYGNSKLNEMKEPHHTTVIWKWKGKAETTATPRKPHANESNRAKYSHACTMHAKDSKGIIHETQYLQVIPL